MVNAGIHTPAELARRAKLHRQAVHKYLAGENEKLTPEKLFKLADALRVNARWLAFGPPESPTPSRSLDPEAEELVQIKETLDRADNPKARDARDTWLSHGRDLVRILTPASSANPFPKRKQRA
jgi:transcriptional regulator with XRE-family HTH domain